MPFLEHRFIVEQIDMRRRAVLQQVNDPFCPGSEVRQVGLAAGWLRRGRRPGVIGFSREAKAAVPKPCALVPSRPRRVCCREKS
ncbi:MAG: hypothetical protein R3C12_13250 [Planctomycetaceae bacterium]